MPRNSCEFIEGVGGRDGLWRVTRLTYDVTFMSIETFKTKKILYRLTPDAKKSETSLSYFEESSIGQRSKLAQSVAEKRRWWTLDGHLELARGLAGRYCRRGREVLGG